MSLIDPPGVNRYRLRTLTVAAGVPLIYLLATAAVAAALAYPVFILTAGDNISWFRSLVSRGGQAILLLGLYPLWKILAPPAGSLGLARTLPRQFTIGFAVGVAILALHVLMLVGLGVRAFKPEVFDDPGRWLSILRNALLAGLGVAVLEETIFRGALFALLRVYAGVGAAVIISAAYYAVLHFLGSHWEGDPAAVGFDTGFRIAADAFGNLAAMPPDSLLGLFLAGVFLALVRARIPRSLGYCYGLHAGWVFVIKTAKPLTYLIPEAPLAFLVGPYDRFVGYLSALWLAVLAVALIGWTRPGKIQP